MKIIDINSFDIGVERWLGNDQFCNRYLRTGVDSIEVQHIYRYGKPSETKIYNTETFKQWRNDILKQKGM